jgi:hypothetical protein
MSSTSTSPADLKAEVRAAWAEMEAPPAKDMAFLDWEYGADATRAFVGVRPVDVDIDDAGFLVATPLLDLPAHAAAAYLGPYLVSLIEGFQMEQALGFPVEVKTRVHTIFTLASPNFWIDIASPHLNDVGVSVLGKVTRFVIDHSEVFQLSSEETRGLERLLRSIDRRLNPSCSR